jgi:enoyl-CoA hydratase
MGSPKVVDDGQVRRITLDRPENANAMLADDVDALGEAVRGIGPDVRAVVITGSGDRSFCAGMHLDTFRDMEPSGGRAFISRVASMLDAVRRCPVATVARLNGTCVGIAFELALACDVRVAHPGVRVGLPEVKLGIPSIADAALLPSFLGPSLAHELILTGDLYTLDELGPSRLVNRLVPPERLDEAVDDLVARLTAPTREVVAAQKGLFETWRNHGIADSVTASIDVFGDVFADPATRDAIDRYRR